MRIISTFMLLIGCILSGPSYSYISTPVLLTPTPMVDQSILFSVRIGQCELPDINNPDYHEVSGGVIKVYINTRNWIACNIPVREWEISAGSHPEGEYTVEVYNIYRGTSGTPATPLLLSSHAVTVQAATYIYHPIPSLGSAGALILMLVTALIALIALRRGNADA